MQAEGDRVGPRFERVQAEQLEHEAELALDPVIADAPRLAAGPTRSLATAALEGREGRTASSEAPSTQLA
jgi:hypothetical protein